MASRLRNPVAGPSARTKPRRILGYARVSSAEQAIGTSLQDQQDALRRYAGAQGLTVAGMYVEAESGIHEKIERREQMRALLAAVRPGDLVLCDKIDRWSRDPEFTYRTMRELREKQVAVYFVGESCDPSTAEGDTMLNFRVLFAREEHKRIKLRMVGTRKALREKGYYSEGRPPFGYTRQDVKGADRNVLVIHEENAATVRGLFKAVPHETLNQMAARTRLPLSRLAQMFRSRHYLGEVETSEGWVKGKHPAIIDPRTFQAAQDALNARTNGVRGPAGHTSDWWTRNLARCGTCLGKMSAAWRLDLETPHYYYRCYKKCGARMVPKTDTLEADAGEILVAHLSDLVKELGTEPAERTARIDTTLLVKRLETKRARILEMYEDGHITRERLRERMSKLDEEARKLETPPEEAPIPPAARREALAAVGGVQRAWERMTPQERRTVAEHLATAVYLVRDEPARFEWRTAEELLREGLFSRAGGV